MGKLRCVMCLGNGRHYGGKLILAFSQAEQEQSEPLLFEYETGVWQS